MQQIQFVVDVLVHGFLRNATMLTDLVHGYGLHSELFEQFETGKKIFTFSGSIGAGALLGNPITKKRFFCLRLHSTFVPKPGFQTFF